MKYQAILGEIKKQTCEALSIVKKLEEITLDKEPKNYEYLTQRLMMNKENGGCLARDFGIETNIYKPCVVYDNAAETLGIEICKQDDMVIIDLPFILPKKKYKKNQFVCDPLRHKFEQAKREYNLKFNEKVVICIVHVYADENSKLRCHDFDNIESKKIIDIVALYTIKDDSPMYCDVYQTMQLGRENKTRIIVLPKSSFCSKFTPTF